MRVGEKLLLLVCRPPDSAEYRHIQEYGTGDALTILRRVFPDLLGQVAGKEVLDFGCGSGRQAVALAELGARRVVGVDINPAALQQARRAVEQAGMMDRVEIVDRLGEEHTDRFDLVLSQNTMEHFADPRASLAAMKRAVLPGGTVFITFGPPWLAPYGSHMYFFTRLPWVHLLFSEQTILKVRSRYRDDGASRYEEAGLNRMTLARFERLVEESGLAVRSRDYECSRGLSVLGRLPWVRELFVNHVSCALDKPLASVSPPAGSRRA
jgi:SAM-dependent methyltransferase